MENKVKIQDLSVGDWVCVEEKVGVHNEPHLTPPMKIVAIGEDWVQLRIDPEQGDPFEYDISEIRGVEITPEILESIGEDWVQLRIDPEQGDPFEYDISEIRGVEITPEILESIGLIMSGDFTRKGKVIRHYKEWTSVIEISVWTHKKSTQISLEDSTTGNWASLRRNNYQAVYVHEFQQMLRLAGVEKEIGL